MSFILRQPLPLSSAINTALKSTPKQSSRLSQIVSRSFHQAPPKQQLSPFKRSTAVTSSHNVFSNTFRRSYQTHQSYNPVAQGGNLTQRLLYGAGIFGATLVGINFIFNRETREDGGMPPFERQYLNDTFLHTGLGIGIIGVASRALHMNGWSYRLMSANPWLVLGVGLVGSIGCMIGCRATPPENYIAKYGLWTAFNLTQAALLSPLFFFSPVILARAGLYTVGMMGSIAFVGATAKTDKYLFLGGPLLAGVTIVALSGLAPMVLPATAVRTMMWTENIWLYGGLAVFGGFTLYDTQKVLQHARLAERGLMKKDPVNESIRLELDFINIFTRMVQILAMQQGRRK
ncbi:hypothetical protein LTR50_002128 [Elasticomyces elasticus]|nr:hypothetical protein LTR50_002128 [Elasticomyces elasticus]